MEYQHINEIKRRRVYLQETYFKVVDFIEIYSDALKQRLKEYKQDEMLSMVIKLTLRKDTLVKELQEVDTMISDRLPFEVRTLRDYMWGDVKVTMVQPNL
jgi:hypothetical protein